MVTNANFNLMYKNVHASIILLKLTNCFKNYN